MRSYSSCKQTSQWSFWSVYAWLSFSKWRTCAGWKMVQAGACVLQREECRQRQRASLGWMARLCIWNPLGLHNCRWPSSSKQELCELAPSRLPTPLCICLIPRAGRASYRPNEWDRGWTDVKISGIYTAPTEFNGNLRPKIFINPGSAAKWKHKSGVME